MRGSRNWFSMIRPPRGKQCSHQCLASKYPARRAIFDGLGLMRPRESVTEEKATHRAAPMLSSEDVGAAIEWLGEAFGFRESGQRFSDDEGRVTHAELSLDGATVFLGWPGPDYRGPKRMAEESQRVARLLQTARGFARVHGEGCDIEAH